MKYVNWVPYILESNPHLVFATFLNEKKLLHKLDHFYKIQLWIANLIRTRF
jgi:hypothetical protein